MLLFLLLREKKEHLEVVFLLLNFSNIHDYKRGCRTRRNKNHSSGGKNTHDDHLSRSSNKCVKNAPVKVKALI